MAPLKRLFGFEPSYDIGVDLASGSEQNVLVHEFFPQPFDGPWKMAAEVVDGYHCECRYRWTESGDLIIDYCRISGSKDNEKPWPSLTAVPDQKKVCFLSEEAEKRFVAPMERKSLAELQQDKRYDPAKFDELVEMVRRA